jgi:hypothetical protein
VLAKDKREIKDGDGQGCGQTAPEAKPKAGQNDRQKLQLSVEGVFIGPAQLCNVMQQADTSDQDCDYRDPRNLGIGSHRNGPIKTSPGVLLSPWSLGLRTTVRQGRLVRVTVALG